MRRTKIRGGLADDPSVRTGVLVAALAIAITGCLTGCFATGASPDGAPSAASSPAPAEKPRTTEVPAPDGTTIDDVIEPAPPAPVHDAALDEVVTLDTGVRVSVAAITGITVEAETPGEVAGPAVAATIRFENESGEALDLGGAMVALLDAAGNVAAPTTSAPAAPAFGSIEDGETTEGIYVFRIPEDTRHEITLTVDYAAGAPVVLFHGAVA